MHFLKPLWVSHEDGKPIFSVDIHPKSARFATGGQGGSGGRIVIWNMKPVLSEESEIDESVPKMLCQMDNHLACVNVVRWSTEGHLLASGGDDKLIMIWRLTNESGQQQQQRQILGGGGKINLETWKCVHTLNYHNGDVLDLSWAPHDAWLASASIDNTVTIWNAHKFPEKCAVLKGHTGLVKGVTWDPVGKYIASQSDDKTLRIWRTSDWSQEEIVTDPFAECSATTHVLRLSWSPDGQYLVSAHAMNGGGPTAQIIERDGWRQDKDFVGHRKAVTCVRFNSNILKKIPYNSQKSQQYCCCAIGSRDRSISVWLTSLKRPLVVIKDLFDDSVLDITWSSNGLYLLACSWDGTVACIQFNSNEIGVPLTGKEKNDLYERVYHKTIEKNWQNVQIIEDADLLKEIDENQIVTPTVVQKEEPKDLNQVQIMNKSVFIPATNQLETRLPCGKKRITPMLLVSTTVPEKIVSIEDSSAFSTSSPTKSQIVIETVTTNKPILESKRMNVPGIEINQFSCRSVPGDQPIVQQIDIFQEQKVPIDTKSVVAKKTGRFILKLGNNSLKIARGTFAHIELFKSNGQERLWDTYLGTVIRCFAQNRKLLVICGEDQTIYTYDLQSGALQLPPFLIEDVVSSVSLSEQDICLVLSKTGLIYMWNLHLVQCLMAHVSIRGLLNDNGVVTKCFLTDSNMPVVQLKDGSAYCYETNLRAWVRLSNPLTGLSTTDEIESNTQLPLANLQIGWSRTLDNTNDTLPAGITLSFLECQLKATVQLKSSTEYRFWLMRLVNHLLDKGPECRLRQLLDDILARKFKKRLMNTDLMDLHINGLLQDILGKMRGKLKWQRLYKEYNEQLTHFQTTF